MTDPIDNIHELTCQAFREMGPAHDPLAFNPYAAEMTARRFLFQIQSLAHDVREARKQIGRGRLVAEPPSL